LLIAPSPIAIRFSLLHLLRNFVRLLERFGSDFEAFGGDFRGISSYLDAIFVPFLEAVGDTEVEELATLRLAYFSEFPSSFADVTAGCIFLRLVS